MSEAAVAFDTHRFVKNLTGKGFTEEQAEALAEEQVSLLNANLVTNARLAKTDERIAEGFVNQNQRIEKIRAELIERIEKIRADLIERIAQSKVELIKWMAGMLVAVVIAMSGMVAALIKFL